MPKIDGSGVYRKCRGCAQYRPLREFTGEDAGQCRVCQPPVATKACACCGLTQPVECFHVDRTARDGRRRECKTCRNHMKRIEWAQQAARIATDAQHAAAVSNPLDRLIRRPWV